MVKSSIFKIFTTKYIHNLPRSTTIRSRCWVGTDSCVSYGRYSYAQHILRNQCEYGTITDTMTLLKPIEKTSVLIPYEQLFIQTFKHNGNLITEQSRGKQNPLFQLAINTSFTSQLFHNRWIPTVRYTRISSNSVTRAGGSTPRYVKTIFICSLWCHSQSIL